MRSTHLRARALLLGLAPTLALPAHAGVSPLALDCLGCHGAAAHSPSMPPLDTLSSITIARTLREYRDGGRSGTAMPRLSKPLSDAQIDAVAASLGVPP